jgi:hypothetical protein
MVFDVSGNHGDTNLRQCSWKVMQKLLKYESLLRIFPTILHKYADRGSHCRANGKETKEKGLELLEIKLTRLCSRWKKKRVSTTILKTEKHGYYSQQNLKCEILTQERNVSSAHNERLPRSRRIIFPLIWEWLLHRVCKGSCS